MDSLSDLLGTYKSTEPPEIAAIKKYVLDQFGAHVSVGIKDKAILITVGNSSLAGMLRLRTVQLQEACGSADKRFIFRIG